MFPILFLSMTTAVFAFETQCNCGVNKQVPNFDMERFEGDWYVMKATEGLYQPGDHCASIRIYEENNHYYVGQQKRNSKNQLFSLTGRIMNPTDGCWQMHYYDGSKETAMIVTDTDYDNHAVIYEYVYNPDWDSCDENTIILSRKRESSWISLNIWSLPEIELIDLDSTAFTCGLL